MNSLPVLVILTLLQFEQKLLVRGVIKPTLIDKLLINIGFITPLTNNFCSNCNRVRITSTGKLFMCLGQNDYVDFRKILRSDYSDKYIKEKIKFALRIKPKKHDFIIEKNLKPYMNRHMNVTGG